MSSPPSYDRVVSHRLTDPELILEIRIRFSTQRNPQRTPTHNETKKIFRSINFWGKIRKLTCRTLLSPASTAPALFPIQSAVPWQLAQFTPPTPTQTLHKSIQSLQTVDRHAATAQRALMGPIQKILGEELVATTLPYYPKCSSLIDRLAVGHCFEWCPVVLS